MKFTKYFICFLCLIFINSFSSSCVKKVESAPLEPISLNLRVHIMRGTPWAHPDSVSLTSWVTVNDVSQTIIPEVNKIWSAANIQWVVESIIEENIFVGPDYNTAVNYILNTTRDENGASNPDRLPYLYGLMQPANRSTTEQVDKNLFHIYLFPFVGNTSQGNAMAGFDYHTVVGTWSNKYTGTNPPERSYLVEDQANFQRGSLAQTISHELGHVLRLNHNECNPCLMQSNGYSFTESQIRVSRDEALLRATP